ncbi:hypothetical protein TB1_021171 [Malus domestica]
MPNQFRPMTETMRKRKRKKSSTLPEGLQVIATAPTETKTDLGPGEYLRRFRAAYLMKESEGCRRQLWCGTGLEKRKKIEV